MSINTLGVRLSCGYGLVVLVLAATVSLTIWRVQEVNDIASELVDILEPTSNAGLEVINGVDLSISTLRGWMLLNDPVYKQERARTWREEIRVPLARLHELSAEWTNLQNVDRLERISANIDLFEDLQSRVEDLAETQPESARYVLRTESVPLIAAIRDELGLMVADQRLTLKANADMLTDQLNELLTLEGWLFAGGLVISIFFAALITRSVTRPVGNAVRVANGIGGGNLEVEVDMGGLDETAHLGAALSDMRDALRLRNREADEYRWLIDGQNRLSEVMRGDQETSELASNIVMFLTRYVGANVGAIYLVDETAESYALAADYALGAGHATPAFKSGEGLVGQSAADRTPLQLDAVDPSGIRVRSSFVDTAPGYIYVVPFVLEDATLGVIELGGMEAFEELHRQFLTANMESIAIALASAIARNKIRSLLEETQQQSEELQQQQEELEQTNEELEEQSQQLLAQQEELRTTNQELEEQAQLIQQKNHEAEAARDDIELKAKQLEASSKYKSEFLANMSHELRTPLNSILILSNDLAENKRDNLTDDQIESAQVISRSGHDLLNLINDILDLSKIEAGKMELNIAPVDLRELSADLYGTFKLSAEAQSLEFEVIVEDSVPSTIRTDKKRLEQVLRNLVANALKFTNAGRVDVQFKRVADAIAIVVIDTGIGVPADKQEIIFEAFRQIEGGTARRFSGTGLGLSICRDLAAMLGGSVSVESKEGEGSRFTVHLPLTIDVADTPAQQREVAMQVSEVTRQPNRGRYLDYPTIPDQRDAIVPGDSVILIVEDDDNFAYVLAAQAREKGFKHINSATGEDALLLARALKPHAIILDLDLPGIDGHLVLRELKADPDTRHIPVHIMSVEEKSLDPIKAGAVDYLTKPVTRQQLDTAFDRIESFMNRKVKNLLVIEDDDTMRSAIVKLIGNGDVRCYEAATGTEASAFLRAEPIDCVILDVGLPDKSGFDLIKEFREEFGDNTPPIIVYTGKDLTKAENQALQEHAESIIVKGVRSEERLLDETALFLHRTVHNLPEQKRNIISNLYDPQAQLRGKHILLVDDDMRNVFALSKVLADQGLAVTKADTGIAALAAINQNPAFDLILMDIMMPEMDGYECMRQIRKQSRFKDTPIVALTAKAMKEDTKKCIEAGANDYIAKPVDVERLLSLMRIWMAR